jgi:hypothetical protein
VAVKVCSNVVESEEEHPTCRSLCSQVAFQSLTYLASYGTALLVLPFEVAHPLVSVAELTRSSSLSGDTGGISASDWPRPP